MLFLSGNFSIFNRSKLWQKKWLVTSTLDYVKLVLERDTSLPNYKRLVLLENDYYANMNVYTDCYDVRFGGPCTLLVAILLLFILGAIDSGNMLYTAGFVAVLFLFIFFRRKKMKKQHLIAEYALDKAIQAKEEALQLF